MTGFAWVTLATNDSYSLGALVLAHSLKQVGTNKELVVLITPGVTKTMREKLSSVFDLVQEVNILDSEDETNLRLLKRPELGVTFTKLHCWRLIQYEKCVFLDADTLVLQNCDELFDREELSAAPDVGWPDCFNSGVFVYRPSNETYQKLIQFALEKGSFDGGDQGLLNLYFSDWSTKDISKHLPFIYNLCSTALYSYLPAFKQFGGNAKIIHFIGSSKPWLQYFNTETKKVQPSNEVKHLEKNLQNWWDLFCNFVHSNLSPEMSGLAGAFAQLTLGAPRTAEQNVLDDHLRRQGWEVGNIDYMGKDSFDNIWSKICETLSTGSPGSKSNESEPVATSDASQPIERSLAEVPIELPKQAEVEKLASEVTDCKILTEQSQCQIPVPDTDQETTPRSEQTSESQQSAALSQDTSILLTSSPQETSASQTDPPSPNVTVASPEASGIIKPETPIPAQPAETPALGALETSITVKAETPAASIPETPTVATSETPITAKPEAPVVATPETLITAKPEIPVSAKPETPAVASPETPVAASLETLITPAAATPETPAVATAETPVATPPQTPVTEKPEILAVASPETPAVATPETLSGTTPETPVATTKSEPTASITAETPVATKPETPTTSETSSVATSPTPATVIPETSKPLTPEIHKQVSIPSQQPSDVDPVSPPGETKPCSESVTVPQPSTPTQEVPVLQQVPPQQETVCSQEASKPPEKAPVAASTGEVLPTCTKRQETTPDSALQTSVKSAAPVGESTRKESAKEVAEQKQTVEAKAQGGSSTASPTPPPRKGSGGGKKSKSKK